MAVESLAGPSAPFPFASSPVSCASSSRCGDGKARREDKRPLETGVSTLPLYRTKSKQKEFYCGVSASQAWVKNTSCLFLRHRLQTSRNPPLLACNTWRGRLRNADVAVPIIIFMVPRKAGPGGELQLCARITTMKTSTCTNIILYDALLQPRGDAASVLFIFYFCYIALVASSYIN